MPKSVLGRVGFYLTLLFVVLFVAKLAIGFPVPSIVIIAEGLLGSVLSTVAFFKGDRATAMLLFSGLVGGFILFLIALEFAFPR
ncbi:MAG: hypothetical protein RL036_110 [Actinomycetota bacterium]|jgi:hypothetical protein